MTIARDIRTGEIVGQVLRRDSPAIGVKIRRGDAELVPLLGRTGYVLVPRSSVRLEEIRDN